MGAVYAVGKWAHHYIPYLEQSSTPALQVVLEPSGRSANEYPFLWCRNFNSQGQ